MSLLSLAQQIAGASGFVVPTSVIGNTDDTATLLLRLINKSGRRQAKLDWQILQKEYTFATVNGTESYALPADYAWFKNNTAWDRTQFWQMRGSLSAQEWQVYKSGIISAVPRERFRVWKNLLYINPIPTQVNNLVMEYVSNGWVTDGAAFFSSFTLDTQTGYIDESLIELEATWRFLERKGLQYQEAKKEADDEIAKALAHDRPAEEVNMSGRPASWPPLPNFPAGNFPAHP